MKKGMLCMVLFFTVSQGLKAQATSPEIVAERIANKMKDTLGLTTAQRDAIYNQNIEINSRKAAIRQQYTNRDSIGHYLQRIEHGRDSLYHTILPEPKYLLYKEKKRFLVSAN